MPNTSTMKIAMTDDGRNPFAALAAMRDTLPPGEETRAEQTPAKCINTGVFHLYYERKGRAGKEATILECPAQMDDAEVTALAALLKRRMGTGGSVRGSEILLQGDRRVMLRDILKGMQHTVKG